MRWPIPLLLATCLAGAADTPFAFTADGEILHANQVSLLGLTVRDVVAVPVIDGDGLRFDHITASGYGGALRGNLRIATGDRQILSGTADLAGVDLATYLRAIGSTSEGIGGTVNASVRFRMPTGKLDELTGDGRLEITDGTLMQLPWLANLLLGEGDLKSTKGADRAEVIFEMAPDDGGHGRIRITRLAVSGPGFALIGAGTMNYDLELDLIVRVRLDGGPFGKVPLLSDGLGLLFSPLRGLLTVKVRGRVSEPKVVSTPYR